MDKCKWNFKVLQHYIRMTEYYRFIILGKRQGQWRELVNINFTRCYKLCRFELPYIVVHKGKDVKMGRKFNYYKCSEFTLISLYFMHIRICLNKETYLNLDQAG